MKRYRFLEHVSDAYIAAYGTSLEEAFENAALSMFSVMTDIKRIRKLVKEEVTVEAENEKTLLHDWLSKLHLKFETERKLFSSFKVYTIDKTNTLFRLTGEAYGEPFDPKRHPSRAEVKAVTYHRMEVVESQGRWTIKFILDL